MMKNLNLVRINLDVKFSVNIVVIDFVFDDDFVFRVHSILLHNFWKFLLYEDKIIC